MALINGGEGDDTITGSNSADTINGRSGSDRITANGGDDTIAAGNGDDLVYGGDGNDTVDTGEGFDTAYGGSGNDSIIGDGGRFFGGAGDDTLGGGEELYGDAGADSISFGIPVLVQGGEGDDVLSWHINPYAASAGRTALIDGGDGIDVLRVMLTPETDDPDAEAPSTNILEIVRNIERMYAGNSFPGQSAWADLVLPATLVQGGATLVVTPEEGSFFELRGVDASAVTEGHLDLTVTGGRARGGQLADVIHSLSRGWLFGERGNDLLSVSQGESQLSGGAGNDTLLGAAQDDTLVGGSGSDSLNGGDGHDTAVFTGNFSDYVIEEIRYNTFTVHDTRGIDGTDTLVDVNAMGFADGERTLVIRGLELIGGDDGEVLTGGSYADRVEGAGGDDTLNGGAGNDVLLGGTGDDQLYAQSGNDVVDAGDGDDLLVAGSGLGDDRYAGGAGIDTIRYTSARSSVSVDLSAGAASGLNIGTDRLTAIENVTAGRGADRIVGNNAGNVINGFAGADVMHGRGGSDTYCVDSTGDKVSELSAAGQDAGGNDLVISAIDYRLGNFVERLLLSGTGSTSGTGNGLRNTMSGNAGSNLLRSLGGNDTIDGGRGNDVLVGGTGKDVLMGGAGMDVFRFDRASDSGPAASLRDVVADFRRGTATLDGDRIDLSGIDAIQGTGLVNDAFRFIGAAKFSTNAAGELRFVHNAAADTLTLYGSTDKDSEAELSIQLNGVASLDARDLVL